MWLGIDLLRARHDLTVARAGFTSVQDALDRGDLATARTQLKRAGSAARHAACTVDGAPFVLYGHVPLVSPAVQELRSLAHAVDSVGNGVLPQLLNSDLRLPTWSGRVDARPFVAAQGPLRHAETELTAVQGRLARTKRSGIGALATARRQLVTALDRLSSTVREARVAADVVPALSGTGGLKRYFVAVQNNAEARATGGLIGAFAIVTLDHGALHLEHVGQNDSLIDPPQPVLDLGKEYDRRYARFETANTWRSANLSPDVPTVGRLLAALWRQQSGQQVDGVVLLDPVGLARILAATGPVDLSDGTSLNDTNAASVMEADIYARHPDYASRYAFLAETTQRAFAALSDRQLNGRAVVTQFARAAASGHLQLWAADTGVQHELLRSRISGSLEATGPFLEVVTTDVGGSKLDYYQHRTIRYDAESTGVAVDIGAGPELEEQAVVSVTLDNQAPAGLPGYVLLRTDTTASKPPVGQSNSWVSVYLGTHATLVSATLDGHPVVVESQTERGLSVYSLFLTIDRGKARTLRLTVRQPAKPDEPLVYRQQPLIRNDDVAVHRKGSAHPVDYAYATP